MTKKIYLSDTNKVFAGVCGGIGEYFEVDPVLVRIITVILVFATGVGFLAYLAAWIIIPRQPSGYVAESADKEYEYAAWHKYLPGIILIAIGAIILSERFWTWMDFDNLWPALLIIAGLVMIFMRGQRNKQNGNLAGNGNAANDNIKQGPLGS